MGKKRGRMATSLRAMDTDWVSMAHRDAKRPRYYCPACGMVRLESSWGVKQVLTRVSPARVVAHERSTDGKNKIFCPGGDIDLVKDRAP